MRVLLALVLACLPVRLAATAVLAFRSPTRLVLAADSRASVYTAGTKRIVEGRCKIFAAGRWWLLHGGFTGKGAADGRPALVAAVARAGTLPEAMAAVAQTFHRELEPQVAAPDSAYRGPLFRPGLPLMATVVAGVERGVLTLGLYGVWLQQREPFALADGWSLCPGALCADVRRPYLWGSSMAGPLVDLVTAPRPPAWLAKADAAAARRLIQLQAAVTPEVGGAIDVLEITTAGAKWVDREPTSACAR